MKLLRNIVTASTLTPKMRNFGCIVCFVHSAQRWYTKFLIEKSPKYKTKAAIGVSEIKNTKQNSVSSRMQICTAAVVIDNQQNDFRLVRHAVRLQRSIVDAHCYEIGCRRTSHAQLLMSALEFRIE
jgi:hypothetical protein